MKNLLNLNSFVMIVLGVSLGLFVYPVIDEAIRLGKAEEIVKTMKNVEFSMNLYFYTEGFEIIRPSRVDIRTLVNRYYLRSDPGSSYRIFWIDPEIESDGEIKALVYFTGSVDPVAMSRVLKDLVWFRSGSVSRNYSEGSHPGMLIVIRKTW